jgi:hypothetical protein
MTFNKREYNHQYYREHKEHMNEISKRWHREHTKEAHAKNRKWRLNAKYGMTVDEWNQIFEAQNRSCAICFITEEEYKGKWHTDHNHETGSVRGILCAKCNLMVGYLEAPQAAMAQVYLARQPRLRTPRQKRTEMAQEWPINDFAWGNRYRYLPYVRRA